jgi:putative transposase
MTELRLSPTELASVILKLVHPLAKGIGARWVWSRGRRYRVYMKLDPVKVAWIITQKETGALNSEIARAMGVSERRVQRLWSVYRATGEVPSLKRPGRKRVEASDEERRIIGEAYARYEVNALTLERAIEVDYGTHIPHNRIHAVLKTMGLARDEPRKQVRKKWIRYERKYSNSLWHTDWTLIEGMGWLIAYLDDASRFVVGYGLFPEATSEHAVEVLKEAVKRHGKPASMLTDRGVQFYAVEAGDRLRGLTAFEKYLIENEVRHVLGRVSHPQTNGKVERFFRTVKDKLGRFESVDELMEWYNMRRPHMSLDLDTIETPYRAYARKMPEGGTVTDEESGETYHAQKK